MGGNRRVARVWVALTVVTILVSACGGGGSTDGADCGLLTTVQTVRGEVIANSLVQASFFNDDQHIVRLEEDGEVIEFEVFGEGGLLELGESYEVELSLWDTADPSSLVAYLHSDEDCSGSTTIVLLDGDGEPVEIEKPPAFSSPISVRTFFLSALAFTAAVAVFGRLSET